jgi:hypothetical protein
MGPVEGTTATSSVSGDVATGARLMIHLKENNIQYLLATLIFYSFGGFSKVADYGSGLC